jgi:hypothetical protein
MLAKWNTVVEKQVKLNNVLQDSTSTQLDRYTALQEYTTATSELTDATKDLADSIEQLFGFLNSEMAEEHIPKKLIGYVKESAETLSTALEKVQDVNATIADAFDKIDKARKYWDEVAELYEDMYKHLFEDSAHLFEELLPADEYPSTWTAMYLGNLNEPFGIITDPDIAQAKFMDLPYKIREQLMIEWFTNHNDGTIAFPSGYVINDFDVIFWTQIKTGWVGAKAALSLLFPAAGKIQDAVDAIEDINLMLDPRDELKTK